MDSKTYNLSMERKSEINQDDIIEEVNTYLFHMPEDYALGHCVARDMRMSAGIAIYFKSIYKGVGQLMDQRPKVGSVAYLQENDRFIYYLITKELSNKKPTYNSITAAITKLRDLIVKHDVKKLAIPRIGCGLDQLNWFKNMSKESELLRINHPTCIRVHENIKEIKKRKFEKLNIILYSRKTTLPVYWDQNFQSVDEKYCFKSQYYEDCQVDLEVGHCLHYTTEEAYIYVIITNKNTKEHFSYYNLEKGLEQIKMKTEKDQSHPTFIIYTIKNHTFENLINQKIVSLMCSAFLDLTPCVIFEIDGS